MPNEKTSSNPIALLATGDEITNGDILNTNSQIIAQKLFSNGMRVGLHMAVRDDISEIEQAITQLLKNHRAIIMTGGLGPTSDDLTRYALSKAMHTPLSFNETVWNAICDRFKQLGYKGAPPEGNRQQALFPENATVIPNPGGTAAGCMLQKDNQFLFMLPGPPMECLPMVDAVVIPELKKSGFPEISYYDHWLLFGVSEGQIAEELDSIAKPFDCTTGYRLAYPYIEFKLYSNNQKDFKALVSLVEKVIAPNLISDGKLTASEMLRKKLDDLYSVLTISDTATGGLLESTIKTPKTAQHLDFSVTDNAQIVIKGLTEYWQAKETEHTHLEITFANKHTVRKQIPFRGRGIRVKQYAMEFICQQINLFLTTSDTN